MIGLACCGGLLRDAIGRYIVEGILLEVWKLWFSSCGNVEYMYLRIDLTRRQVIICLCVENDRKVMINMVRYIINFNGSMLTLVWWIRQLLDFDWQIHFSHTWQKENRSADRLHNFCYSQFIQCSFSRIFLWRFIVFSLTTSFLLSFVIVCDKKKKLISAILYCLTKQTETDRSLFFFHGTIELLISWCTAHK